MKTKEEIEEIIKGVKKDIQNAEERGELSKAKFFKGQLSSLNWVINKY